LTGAVKDCKFFNIFRAYHPPLLYPSDAGKKAELFTPRGTTEKIFHSYEKEKR
jgi:hypothetical protein